MPDLVTVAPIPFDGTVMPFTKTDSFFGAGVFFPWSNAGPYYASGALWRVCLNVSPTSGVDRPNYLNVYKSTDGGSTWIEADSGGRPQLSADGTLTAPQCDCTFGHDEKFYIVVKGLTTDHLNVQIFDTGSGVWQSPYTGGPLVVDSGAQVNDLSIYQNSTDTDLIVIYNRTNVPNNNVAWTRIVGGTWQTEHTITAFGVDNAIIQAVVDSADLTHVFYSDDAGAISYRAIHTDDSLGGAVSTGWSSTSFGPGGVSGKPVIWQGVIALPAVIEASSNPQPFVLIASPASAPSIFTSAQVFSESASGSIGFNDSGMRLAIDGGGALWCAWGYFSIPGAVCYIGVAQLCSPSAAWGNHRSFWDLLTNPQTDQGSAGTPEMGNWSFSYISATDTFGGMTNIFGSTATYAYYLKSDVAVSSITACGAGGPRYVNRFY